MALPEIPAADAGESEIVPVAARAAVTARLEAAGLTVTAQRLAIARLLFARNAHFSADEVQSWLRERGCQVSKATVYNTLNTFARRGLLREVLVDPARVFFDSNTRPHHHVYDVDSGELHDFDASLVSVSGLPAFPADTEVESVDVVVRIRRASKPL